MKWLAGLLVLVNAALFLWAAGPGVARTGSGAAYPVVNPEAMALLSEVQRNRGAAGEDAARCARIGPFVDSAVMAVAAQKLDALALPYTRRTVKAREIRAYRVFMGPFASESALQAGRRRLDDAGVEDYYVTGDDGTGRILSLGLFSQSDGAQILQRRLARRGIEAGLRTEDRVLKANFWLEIDNPAAARGLPDELAGARWGEKGARVRRYDCP